MNLLERIPAPVWYGAFALVGGLILLALARRGAVAAAQAVNPLDHDNIFAASVNAVGSALTEDGRPVSLGAGIYNLFHRDEFAASEREHKARLAARSAP